jgi:hypothetical protein
MAVTLKTDVLQDESHQTVKYYTDRHNTTLFIICKKWATSFGLTLDHLQDPTSIQLSMNKNDKMCNQHCFKKTILQDDILYGVPFFQVLNISYRHSYIAYIYKISNCSSVHTPRSASIVYLQIHL